MQPTDATVAIASFSTVSTILVGVAVTVIGGSLIWIGATLWKISGDVREALTRLAHALEMLKDHETRLRELEVHD